MNPNIARMKAGEIYDPADPEIMAEQTLCLELLYDYNATRPSEAAKRTELLQKMLASCGKDCYIEPPFRANWGGHNIHLGEAVYANFNLTCVDDAPIYIGDRTMIGPNVTIATAAHPLHPDLRGKLLQYNKPVTIGKECWIGAGALIMPGVTIGNYSVIGAGSVVTKDIPEGVLAYGSPCRIIRSVYGKASSEPQPPPAEI